MATRDGSYVSPTSLLSISLLCAVVLALIGLGSWNPVVNLSGQTYAVIALGLIVFLATGELVSTVVGGYSTRRLTPADIPLRLAKAESSRVVGLALLSIIASGIWYVGVSRAVGSISPSVISFTIKNHIVECETNLTTLMRCFCSAMASLSCVFISEVLFGAQRQYRRRLPLGILLFASSFVPPAVHALRTDLFHILVGLFVVAVFLSARKSKSIGKTLLKILLIVILIPVVVKAFFSLVELMQRTETGIRDPWEYFSFYLGSGIPRLDILLRTDTSIPAMDLGQLANSLQVLLHNLHLPIDPGMSASEKWTYLSTPGHLGDFCNLSTLFGPAYSDFGYIGVAAVSAFLATVFHLVYQNAVFRGSELALTIYSSISYILIEAMRDDFFSYWLGTVGIATLVFTVWGFVWLTKPSRADSKKARLIVCG